MGAPYGRRCGSFGLRRHLIGPDPTIGLIFHAAVGLALLGPKTRRVVTPEYRDIVVATPQMKRPTSSAAWALLGVLLLLLVGVIAAGLWHRFTR